MESGKELPSLGNYGSGLVFLSQDPNERIKQKKYIESICLEEKQNVIFWRDVPINDGEIGPTAKKARPFVEQLFINLVLQTENSSISNVNSLS